MAIGIHVARVGFFNVDDTGSMLSKDDPQVTIKQYLQTESQHRLVIDPSIPNTSGNPTVKAYLEAEADADYVLEYMDQNTIITYHRNSSGGFEA